jgi:hypothetical protein
MIKRGNRDLLVVPERLHHSTELEGAIQELEKLLSQVEFVADIAEVSEVIDLNRYRLIKRGLKVERLIRDGSLRKPFYFLTNLN